MTPAPLDSLRRQFSFLAGKAQPLRVLLTLGGLLAASTATGHAEAVIPLFLGAIASALAETDDSWHGRLRAQVVTLGCFAIVAFATLALADRPWLFIAVLAPAAVALTMLGAVEARYRAIGYATLILAMYAVIGISNLPVGAAQRRHEPVLLLIGAAGYGVFSVLSAALFPAMPVQAHLVRLFNVLGDFVRLKASLFEPIRGVNVERQRLALAWLNAQVVTELNASKESLFRRIGHRQPASRIARYRGLYLIAQDVHERASSSHDDYNALADAFFHSDLLYRCQRVLTLQGDACTRLARSIERNDPFLADPATLQALSDLRSAIEHERADPQALAADPARAALLSSLEALNRNLAQLESQLSGASTPSALAGRTDVGLFDRSPRGWHDAVERVRRNLTPRSVLFRHALRLAIALTIGHVLMRAIHPAQGYWILLTSLFVLQQTYGETVSRMSQRVAGTVLGVIAGWALQRIFPEPPVQALLAVAAGVLFFGTRSTRYLIATASMTVLVLMCFEQIGDSHLLFVPRLVDTIVGSVIAVVVVLLVLPNWQARHFNELAAAALRGHAGYLEQIASQYRSGARDDLAYRLARRNAHNADAALSAAVTDMFREPGNARERVEAAMRILIQSHTLLNYLSALGAHRIALSEPAKAATLLAAAEGAASVIQALANELQAGSDSEAATGAGIEAPPHDGKQQNKQRRHEHHRRARHQARPGPTGPARHADRHASQRLPRAPRPDRTGPDLAPDRPPARARESLAPAAAKRHSARCARVTDEPFGCAPTRQLLVALEGYSRQTPAAGHNRYGVLNHDDH